MPRRFDSILRWISRILLLAHSFNPLYSFSLHSWLKAKSTFTYQQMPCLGILKWTQVLSFCTILKHFRRFLSSKKTKNILVLPKFFWKWCCNTCRLMIDKSTYVSVFHLMSYEKIWQGLPAIARIKMMKSCMKISESRSDLWT